MQCELEKREKDCKKKRKEEIIERVYKRVGMMLKSQRIV